MNWSVGNVFQHLVLIRSKCAAQVIRHPVQLRKLHIALLCRDTELLHGAGGSLQGLLVVCGHQQTSPLVGGQVVQRDCEGGVVACMGVRCRFVDGGGEPLRCGEGAFRHHVGAAHQLHSKVHALLLRALQVRRQPGLGAAQVRLVGGVERAAPLTVVLRHEPVGDSVDRRLEVRLLRVHQDVHADARSLRRQRLQARLHGAQELQDARRGGSR
mmetsp:Transcript_31049/g.59946  ORF Transcript_31049/g.59946 Transcript_31049/m.59946 type:complete len:213 (-) Transcript_31049:806-1444(-)